MDVHSDIARQMNDSERATLARFRAAAKDFKKLPCGLNTLPSGFLACSFHKGETVGVLTPFGMRVALAAEKLAQSAEEAA
jgi:hypothetical protein